MGKTCHFPICPNLYIPCQTNSNPAYVGTPNLSKSAHLPPEEPRNRVPREDRKNQCQRPFRAGFCPNLDPASANLNPKLVRTADPASPPSTAFVDADSGVVYCGIRLRQLRGMCILNTRVWEWITYLHAH